MVYTQEGVIKDSKPWGRMMAAGAAAVTLAVAMFASAFAATSVAVMPTDIATSNTGGWWKYGDGSATIVNTADGDMLRLDTSALDSYIRVKNEAVDMNLQDLSTLSYQTKQVNVSPSSSLVSSATLRLFIDTDGNGTQDDVLVYEPYYQNATQPIDTSLQTWDAKSGFWWSSDGDMYGSLGGPGAGSYATNFTIADVLAVYPSAKILAVNLGSDNNSNSTFVVDADMLTINDTIYDFELPETKPQVLSAQDCKNGGYNNVATKEGKDFKNQGACVSYVQANSNASFKRNGQ